MNKENVIQIRCTPEQKALVARLAEIENRSITNYIINLILEDNKKKEGNEMKNLLLEKGVKIERKDNYTAKATILEVVGDNVTVLYENGTTDKVTKNFLKTFCQADGTACKSL